MTIETGQCPICGHPFEIWKADSVGGQPAEGQFTRGCKHMQDLYEKTGKLPRQY
jgi:hypothetical protein